LVHVRVDHATRLAYVEILDDERGPTSTGFLARAVAWFTAHRVFIERVMTDNGAPFRSRDWARRRERWRRRRHIDRKGPGAVLRRGG